MGIHVQDVHVLEDFQYFPSVSVLHYLQAVFFYQNFHKYLIQLLHKSAGTKYHFKQVKVPGNGSY